MRKYPKSPYSLSDTLHKRDNEYFGKYRGTVLDNEDPDEKGRCKVFVYGVYDEHMKENDGNRLPWAEPCLPLFCGGMGEYGDNGMFNPPDVGATVWVSFESGDITRPIMEGITADKNGIFNILKAKIHWEGMDIEFNKFTHSISISADEVRVNCKRGDVKSEEAFLNTQTLSLTSGEINIKSDEISVDSASVNIKTKNMEVDGGFVTTSGVANGSINGQSVATVKNGIVVAIT